jgi:Eco57I restriction-modification methylase
MEQATRNKLRNVVTQCRKLLEESIAHQLEGQFGIRAGQEDAVRVEDEARMSHLSDEDQQYRRDLLDHFEHIKAGSLKPKDALDQLIREIAFTHLNRLCAYKMMEARDVYVGGQKFREAVGRGIKSNGFLMYLGTEGHEEDERLFNTGQQELAYRHFLDWLGGRLSEEIGVLFNPNDPANRLYPRQKTLDELLDLLNGEDIKPDEKEVQETWPKIWEQDETIGWVYQYFTPKELRDKARKESQAPRNPYELAFRNQFFTPRYVVEFLTDNTLGRIWYEMRKGDTKLKDQCQYMVRRPNEIFLDEGMEPPEASGTQDDLSQEELLKQAVYISHRPKKDPRELKILDPACGSGHFLLYCFDLLLTIYEEAYSEPDLGPALQKDYTTLDDLRRDVPRLILAHNLHGIDIDLRCTQIAALALWLRCQRAYRETGLKKDRPSITRSNLVCAEPMPGEEGLLDEFLKTLHEDRLEQLIRRVMDVPDDKTVRTTPEMADRLCELVHLVWDRMKLAGEAGSLLKIEEEIQEAIRTGQVEWEADQPLFRVTQYALTEEPQEKYIRFVPGEGVSFWERAEALVMAALDDFAEYAANGRKLLRTLFVDDAMRGFAFVDVCRQRFDVVLMNPPFGLAQKHLNKFLRREYPDTYVDLYASFVTRGLQLAPAGFLGAITSRAFMMTKKLARWRQNELIDALDLMLDLGSPVMDDAFVEACAFCASTGTSLSSIVAFDRRFASEKDVPPRLSGRGGNSYSYCARKDQLHALPQAKILYSLPSPVYSLLKSPHVFEPTIGTAREGMRTFDDVRFLRLRWEVSPTTIGADSTWEALSKGGEFAIYYSDIHLVVKWARQGKELAEENQRVNGQTAQSRQASEFWRRPGGTYSKRSVKGFSVRALPAGCIFGTKGPAILSESDVPSSCLIGWLNSRLIRFLVHVQANAYEFNTGIIKRLPWKSDGRILRLADVTQRAIEAWRDAAALSEVNSLFVSPIIASDFSVMHACATEKGALAGRIRDECCAKWDATVDEVYGVDSSMLGEGADDNDEVTGDDEEDAADEIVSPVDQVHSVVSYTLGVAAGRWDVRFATGERQPADLPDPFAALPVCAPGALQGSDGLPVTKPPEVYPLQIDWDGILVDDPGNEDDMVRRVREVLEVIWKDRADAIEKEACEILGVKALWNYFRKPGKDGFWDEHVKRYSKSRRKAPIYWLLQSSKKNYALWLYYHRLDKDMLFKALLNYVEPKIQREENRLAELRSQKSSAGDSGKEAKKLDRGIEQQEDLLVELRDFEEELRKVANLHLIPDINDGVVLNIAPLHELVPWKEAKKYWNELMDGKYEWSSIGKQLREKGLVK